MKSKILMYHAPNVVQKEAGVQKAAVISTVTQG